MSNRQQKISEFLITAGWAEAHRTPLAGDASTRAYSRLSLGEDTALLMDAPQDAETVTCPSGATAQERKTLGYNACARLAGSDMMSFATIAKALTDHQLSAPHILALDAEQGFALLEDFGDDLYASAIKAGMDEHLLYENAIDVLSAIAEDKVQPRPDQSDGNTALMSYDETAMQAEVDLLVQWYWPLKTGTPFPEALTSDYEKIWHGLFARLPAPTVMVLRDYHAENLLWLPERKGTARTGLIDFQDALIGHKAYDLVSLLEDARRDVSPALAALMKERYCNNLSMSSNQRDDFDTEYAILGAQRNAKILGIFARLANRDGKKRYLDLLPRVEAHFSQNLQHPALGDIKAFLQPYFPELTA